MNELETKHYRLATLIPLIIINLAIIIGVFLLCLVYSHKVARDSESAVIDSFSTTVSTLEQNAYVYLKNQQLACDDWAKYLYRHPCTPEEAIEYLIDANSASNVMVHVVSAKTLTGLSTVDSAHSGNTVDYRKITDIDFGSVKNDSVDSGYINVLNLYTNPTNGMPVVGFARCVPLRSETGETEDYYLIRVVPKSVMTEMWTFPIEFGKAEMSLIKNGGNYIIRSSTLRNTNFWEYLNSFNAFGYGELDKLKVDMLENGAVYHGLDVYGNDAYYVCRTSEQNGDWCFVGYLPGSSVDVGALNWWVTGFVSLGFVILIIVNGLYILSINLRLKASVVRVKEADMAKTRFLSSMSHDIRTPMNAIIGMTAIAAKNTDDPERVKECLAKIELASGHLLTLVNDVLDVSKVESGKMTLTPVEFSLSAMLGGITNIVRQNIKAKDLDFDIRVRNIYYETLCADELRLNQIFINLLSNAVKYTPRGGKVTVTVNEERIPSDDGSVILIFVVEDTGIGMTPEFRKNMYTAFSRAVDTRIDKIQGSGLGLAIVKQMVDLMNGTIDCESEPGKGTKFTVCLKLKVVDNGPVDRTFPPMDILVADDDEVFLEAIKDTLVDMNLRVDTVTSGREAIRLITERAESGNAYPAVIIDFKMPDMDGIETAKAIREKIGNEVPIIIISSYDILDIEDRAREAGVSAFISKPLFRSTVYGKLSEIFGNGEVAEKPKESLGDDLRGMHLLIAEDNDLNFEIIEELLGANDITSERAVNGEECVKMLAGAKENEYDAILMDIQMPVMNGYEACRAIRSLADPVRNSIPIIAMTADAFAEDVRSCMDAGMNGHVAKPIDMNKLFAELRAAKAL